MSKDKADRLIVGALEVCSLPDLGIHNLEVRVDTGAKTSSLHADNVRKFIRKGRPWVSFDIHPDAYHVEDLIACESPLRDIRSIKSSNGQSEERYVIETPMLLGERTWVIELTLTNRAEMKFAMLLGRQGMSNQILVDPSQNFLLQSSD